MLPHYTFLRSGCPVESEEARGGINRLGDLAPGVQTILRKDTCGSRSWLNVVDSAYIDLLVELQGQRDGSWSSSTKESN